MSFINAKQEAPLKTVEAPAKGEHEKSAPVLPLHAQKGWTPRAIDPLKISQALVTLAPAGAELDAKQQVMAEQFRNLRTKIKALSRDLQLRTILITSALPGEGKTTIAANLAGSLSRVEGLRVLLMDFDLRKPTLHTVFGVEADPRAESPLASDIPWQQGLYRLNRRLDVLFAFRQLPEPDHLLQSPRLETILEEARTNYDVVILDSAPLLAVADTQALVPLVDCSLFVLNADETPVGAAREALGMLRDKVVGSVVNRVTRLKSEGYYLKSGYGYGYGSHRSEN